MYSKTDINRYRTYSDNIRREVQLSLKEDPSEGMTVLVHQLSKEFPAFMNRDYEEVVHINQELMENLLTEKKTDYALIYLWSLYLTRGIGFHSRNNLLHFLAILSNVSFKRLLEIEEELLEDGWWNHGYNDRIYVTSYRKITTIHDIRSSSTVKIPAEYLFFKRLFIHHIISLTHLKLQNAFRYHYKNIYWNSRCKVSPIDPNEYPSRIDKVGCSIRKVAEHLQLSYKYCHSFLKGSLKKQYNLVEAISIEEFDQRYDRAFFIENPKYSFKKEGSIFKIFVALGSTNDYKLRKYLKPFGKSHLSVPLWEH